MRWHYTRDVHGCSEPRDWPRYARVDEDNNPTYCGCIPSGPVGLRGSNANVPAIGAPGPALGYTKLARAGHSTIFEFWPVGVGELRCAVGLCGGALEPNSCRATWSEVRTQSVMSRQNSQARP